MKKLFFLALIFCFHSTISYAETCTAMPSCAELGYYRGTNIACGDDDSRYIACPYDPDYRKCVNYDCEEMGFIKDGFESLKTWCKKIIFCEKDNSYVLCGDIDEPKTVCVPTYCTPVTVPENAVSTASCAPLYVDCTEGETVDVAWACKGGYTESGGKCVAMTCADYVDYPYNSCTGKSCDTQVCLSAAKASGKGTITCYTAPMGNCTRKCTEEHPTDGTTTKPTDGYAYSIDNSVTDGPCYYNISAKTCASYGWQGSTCTSGYTQTVHANTATGSTTATCYECVAKTCTSYGWQSSTCGGDGYVQTTHANTPLGSATAPCYECRAKSCADYSDYPYTSCNKTCNEQTCNSTSKASGNGTITCFAAPSGTCPLTCTQAHADGTTINPGSGYTYSTDNSVTNPPCYYNLQAKDCTSYGWQEDYCTSGYTQNPHISVATGGSTSTCYECTAKTCASYGWQSSQCSGDGYKQTPHTSVAVGSTTTTCYECTAKTCSDYSDYPYTSCNKTCDEQSCSSALRASGTGSITCYTAATGTCPQTCAQAHADGTTTKPGSGYTYDTDNSVTDAPCYYNRMAKTCASYGWQPSTCGSGYDQTTHASVAVGSSTTTCYQCTAKTCSSYGWQISTCSGSGYNQTKHTGTATGDTTTTCYECTAKTCSDYSDFPYGGCYKTCDEQTCSSTSKASGTGNITCYTAPTGTCKKSCLEAHPTDGTTSKPGNGYNYSTDNSVSDAPCYYNRSAKTCASYGWQESSCDSYEKEGSGSPAYKDTGSTTTYCHLCITKSCSEMFGGTTTKPGSGYDYDTDYWVSDAPCYYNVTAKTCASYGWQSSACGTGYKDDTGSPADKATGNTTTSCHKCVAKSCSDTYSDGTTSKPGDGYTYSSTTVNGSTCYYNLSAKTCSSYGWQSSECGDGYDQTKHTSVKVGSSTTTCYDCTAKTCSSYGWQDSQCGDGYDQTTHTGTKTGSTTKTCYECSAKTCASYGWQTSSYCSTGYNKVTHSNTPTGSTTKTCYECVAKTCSDYSDYPYDSCTGKACPEQTCSSASKKSGSGNITCYTAPSGDCKKSCADTHSGGTTTKPGDGWTYDTDNNVTDAPCYYNKVAKTCASYGWQSGSCSDGYEDDSGSPASKATGDTTTSCHYCKAKTCSSYGWQSSTCGSGYNQTKHTSVKVGSSTTTCYECTAKTCSDYSGWQSGSCSSCNKDGTGSPADKATGSTTTQCHKCVAKSCTDLGFYASQSTCESANTGYNCIDSGSSCRSDCWKKGSADCSSYTEGNGWYTSEPSGCYIAGENATCGGKSYRKYIEMDETCSNFADGDDNELYPWTNRNETYHFDVEWNSVECRCQINAQLGNGPVEHDIQSCPTGLYPGEIPHEAGFVWFHDKNNYLILCEGFIGGEGYWHLESVCQSRYGSTAHLDEFSADGDMCSKCDYYSGRRAKEGEGINGLCVSDPYL